MMMAWQKIAICTMFLFTASIASAAQTDAAVPRDLAEKAIHVVTAKSVLDTKVLVPETRKPLPSSGRFSVNSTRSEPCSKTPDPCLSVSYRAPDADVVCEWTVLLPGDASDGQLLAENDNAARYFFLRLAPTEAAAFVQSRSIAQDPPIARAAHLTGDVTVRVVVGPDGLPKQVVPVNGPAMLQGAAIEAAKKWHFKHCTVGGRAVRYQMEITFMFRSAGELDPPVESKP